MVGFISGDISPPVVLSHDTNHTQLGVVMCGLSQSKPTDDWRRTSLLRTIIMINKVPCKVILDSGSCINAISHQTVIKTGLKLVPHPQPLKVSWINTNSLQISDRCLVPIHIAGYEDNIWCDVVNMDVGSIILGRPWLFDLNVTLYGKSNSCSFLHKGRKIRINPIQPMSN